MRCAVIKLGSRISFSTKDTSGGNGEARSVISLLDGSGIDVSIYTKLASFDILDPKYKWTDVRESTNTSDCDFLMIMNGSVNFFAGKEDEFQINNYKIINNFKGKVFYILCDPALALMQIWSSIKSKPWANKYSEKEMTVSRTDIIYISQAFDTEKILTHIKPSQVKPESVVHFPFEKFPLLHAPLDFNSDPMIDLSYGGTMRQGRRTNKMIKFYFGHPPDIEVELFGKIDREDFQESKLAGLSLPKFLPPVEYADMMSRMNKSSSHCVLGDPLYEKTNDIPQRMAESINASVVTFVDSDMDKLRRFFNGDRELIDFLYVESREQLSDRIRLIREESFRKDIVAHQFSALDFDATYYKRSFHKLIGSFL
jgi:hypothetical protein